MPSAIVVGAGLSGLVAARELHRARWQVTVLEAQDRVGGRIKTDCVDGFILDRGFQVYLTAYETASTVLDLDALNLGHFPAGALVQYQGNRYRVCDPLRSPWYLAPWHCLQTCLAPVGTFRDKLRIASFRNRVCKTDVAGMISVQQVTARDRLEQMGFSSSIIDRFFRPFFGGIFLEDSLQTNSGMMEFVFRTFSLGYASLPREGMHAIPKQIASSLPASSIRLNSTVRSIDRGRVSLSDGSILEADHVIVATEQPAAAVMLGEPCEEAFTSTSCLYFDVPSPPLHEGTLVLNGDGEGVINHLCFPNFAQPSYAPAGHSLLSVNTINHVSETGESLLKSVVDQLVQWFGEQVTSWRHLRTYRIPYALNAQTVQSRSIATYSPRVSEHIWRCGDYCKTSSIEGAIQSGLEIAKLVQQDNGSA